MWWDDRGGCCCSDPACSLPCFCRASGEALLVSSSTDLESGAAGLLRLHYVLLPCEPSAGRPAALCAKRVASAEELLSPLLPAGGACTAELPPAVTAAVTAQLAELPLAEQLDPLALSSRSSEVVEVGAARRSKKWRRRWPAAGPVHSQSSNEMMSNEVLPCCSLSALR